MNNSEATLPAAWRLNGIQRLDFVYDWNEIHKAVQSILSDLDPVIRRTIPGARIIEESNSASAWYLFSYRVFSASENDDIDPVVVGIMFSPGSHGTLVHGDIVGETTGDILFETPERERIGGLAILEAAQDIAEDLARQAPVVISAIENPARRS